MKPQSLMGDVRVKVRLSNAVEEYMARRHALPPSEVHSVEAIALADTSAVCSVIPAQVAQLLGIKIAGSRPVEYADGHIEEVEFTEPILFSLQGRETADDALVLGNEVLIGQTVLEKMDFLVDCKNQRLVGRHPEGPIIQIKRGAISFDTRRLSTVPSGLDRSLFFPGVKTPGYSQKPLRGALTPITDY